MPTLTCPVCGKEFHKPPAWIKRSQNSYCSKECASLARVKVQPEPPPDTPRCACGCGGFVSPRSDGKPYRYIKGHGDAYRVDHNCTTCGKAFKVQQWRITKFGVVFCSRECAAVHRTKSAMKEYVCEFCGKHFTLNRSKRKDAHIYCSYHCFNEARKVDELKRVKVNCAHCGKELAVYPSKTKTNKHHYCDVICRKKHIMGANNPSYTSGRGRRGVYGRNWKSQRNATITRDQGICQSCGKKPKIKHHLHVHHITPFYQFNGDWLAANDLTNLITLCMKCHKRAEKGEVVIQRKML